jgi:hypothetical protein
VTSRPSQEQSSADPALMSQRPPRITENDEYMGSLQRILRAYGRRVAAGDIDALAGLAAMAGQLDGAMQHGINGLRDAGYSWAEIGTQLGITRQGAQQRWGDKDRGRDGHLASP